MFEVLDFLLALIEEAPVKHVGNLPNSKFVPGFLQFSLRDTKFIEEILGRCIGPLAEAGSMRPGEGQKPLAVISAIFRSSWALQTSHSSLKLSTLL